MSVQRLRLGIQKKGKLSRGSRRLLQSAGIEFDNQQESVLSQASSFPLEILFLKQEDIPEYVASGVLDAGIVAHSEIEERNEQLEVVKYLDFAKCRLSIVVPNHSEVTKVEDLEGLTVATYYPNMLKRFLQIRGVKVCVRKVSGLVETTIATGLADAICGVVRTGSALAISGLKELETIFYSEAVLVTHNDLPEEKREVLDKLLLQLEAALRAKQLKCIMFNIAKEKLEDVANVVASIYSPSYVELSTTDWYQVTVVIKADRLWEVVEKLRKLGASNMLVLPVEKAIY